MLGVTSVGVLLAAKTRIAASGLLLARPGDVGTSIGTTPDFGVASASLVSMFSAQPLRPAGRYCLSPRSTEHGLAWMAAQAQGCPARWISIIFTKCMYTEESEIQIHRTAKNPEKTVTECDQAIPAVQRQSKHIEKKYSFVKLSHAKSSVAIAMSSRYCITSSLLAEPP